MAEGFACDQANLHKVSKQPHNVFASVDIGLHDEALLQRLDNASNDLVCELKVVDCHLGEQRRVQIDFVRHTLDAL